MYILCTIYCSYCIAKRCQKARGGEHPVRKCSVKSHWAKGTPGEKCQVEFNLQKEEKEQDTLKLQKEKNGEFANSTEVGKILWDRKTMSSFYTDADVDQRAWRWSKTDVNGCWWCHFCLSFMVFCNPAFPIASGCASVTSGLLALVLGLHFASWCIQFSSLARNAHFRSCKLVSWWCFRDSGAVLIVLVAFSWCSGGCFVLPVVFAFCWYSGLCSGVGDAWRWCFAMFFWCWCSGGGDGGCGVGVLFWCSDSGVLVLSSWGCRTPIVRPCECLQS